MRRTSLRTVPVVAALACGLSGGASAQFFIDLNGVIGPVTCTTTGIAATGTGTSSYHLPPPPNNEILTQFVNGVVEQSQFSSISPPDNNVTGSLILTITFVSTHALPYVATVEAFPAVGGRAVGRGIRGVATCPAGGPGTLVLSSIVAPGTSAVPALSSASLAWLGALLALVGALGLRRRRAPAR